MALTAQTLFDNALRQIRKQGGGAIDDGICKYRTADGRMCAIGASIPDDLYHPSIENKSIKDLEQKADLIPMVPKILEYLGLENMDLLDDIQFTHDRAFFEDYTHMSEWEKEIAKVAAKHNLYYTL